MPTNRTVDQIKANLLQPALTSHFEVSIPRPGGLTSDYLSSNGVKYDQIKLNLLCSEASLPGSSLATHEINNDFTGVTERHVYRRLYDDRIDLSFYVDAENYLPIRYFETWMKYIVGENISEKEGGRVGTTGSNYFYRMNYPEGTGGKNPSGGYVADGMKVTKFERTGKNSNYTGGSLEYTFVRVFPISVSSIPVSYDTASLLKCTVSLTYLRYVVNPVITPNTNVNGSSPQQLAAANSLIFNQSVFTNPQIIPNQTIGGVSLSASQLSGNSINLQQAANLNL
jgi:hypothetical protein